MFGNPKPVGVRVRVFTLDPTGNNEEAEAARAALQVYADKLSLSPHDRLQKKAADIRKWIEDEHMHADIAQVTSELNGAMY